MVHSTTACPQHHGVQLIQKHTDTTNAIPMCHTDTTNAIRSKQSITYRQHAHSKLLTSTKSVSSKTNFQEGSPTKRWNSQNCHTKHTPS